MSLEISNLEMTAEELNEMIEQLSKVYDIVRIVDVGRMRVMTYDQAGKCHVTDQACHEVWGRSERCKNCISGMAFREKSRLSKFEFIDHDVYHVTTQYIVVDGTPCNLEIVEKNSDKTLMGAFGRNRFIDMIKEYADTVYTDSLTKVSNRKYFDEQLIGLEMDAVAMIDIDDFKSVNDTHGHICGDKVLHAVAQALRNSVRGEDNVVRYGGDEFLLSFSMMQKDCLYERLEEIRKTIEHSLGEGNDKKQVSISIGGACGRDQITRLLELADQALYEAKKHKNHVTVISNEMI